MRTSPSGHQMPSPHSHIDPRDADVEWPEYTTLRSEFIALSEQLGVTQAELRGHRDTRRAAEVADRDAYAAALRAGKKDPGQKHVTAWEERDADLSRRVDALRSAVDDIDGELDALVIKHQHDYRNAALRARDAAVAEYTEAIERVIELRERAVVAGEVVLQLDAILGGKAKRAVSRHHARFQPLANRNEEPFGWQVIAAAFREDAELLSTVGDEERRLIVKDTPADIDVSELVGTSYEELSR